MRRATKIRIEYDDEIERALERFGDHEDMSEARLLKWLEQFEASNLPLALRIIGAVKYYNGLRIRALTKQLFARAVEEITARGLSSIGFVAAGDPGSGSGVVTRVLRELVRGTPYRMMTMLDLDSLKPGEIDALVFIDDFSGTGGTLTKWWDNVEPLVRPTDAMIFIGLLVLNQRARQTIESFAEVIAVEELGGSDNILSDECTTFHCCPN